MEYFKLFLGATGLFAFLLSIVQLILKALENRRIAAVGKQQQETETDSRWNATYRSRAEVHLAHDVRTTNRVYRLQDQVNDERADPTVKPPIEWPELPEAPPLFPPPPAA